VQTEVIRGNLDPAHISTSLPNARTLQCGSQTRLSNAFSKKFENHCHALALYFFWYNWVRIHETLGVTPAMAAGLSDKLLSMSDLAEMIDEALPKPGKRGPYKTKNVAFRSAGVL
jgi:hypothetical protein